MLVIDTLEIPDIDRNTTMNWMHLSCTRSLHNMTSMRAVLRQDARIGGCYCIGLASIHVHFALWVESLLKTFPDRTFHDWCHISNPLVLGIAYALSIFQEDNLASMPKQMMAFVPRRMIGVS
jgi:hypothetical protein